MQIANNLANQIEKDGFVIIRNVLSKNEIEKLREIVKNHFNNKCVPSLSGLTQPNAAVDVPEVGWLFSHPKIIYIVRHLLKHNDIVFTSHCDVHSNRLSGWHKDDGMTVMEGGYFGQPTYEKKDCRVYKVAIYLQDHFYNKGGLTVRKGSHHFPSRDQGEEVYLKTRAGDAIVFDVRLTHTGQREVIPIPLIGKPINLLPGLLKRLFGVEKTKTKDFFKKIGYKITKERLSIFFTYGADNDYTKYFALNNMKRQILQNQSKNIFLSPSLRQKLLEAKVLLAEDYFEELVDKNSLELKLDTNFKLPSAN